MTKLSTAVVLSLFVSFVANAQISKGTWLLGGGVSLWGNGNNSNDSHFPVSFERVAIGLTPTAGVFVSDRWVVGLSPSWGYSREERTNPRHQPYWSMSRSTSYGVSLFARYYVPLSGKWYAFGNLSTLTYTRGKTVHHTTPAEGENTIRDVFRSRGYNIGANLSVGVTYFITPKIGIEASVGSIGYSFGRVKNVMEPEFGGSREETVKTNGGGLTFNPAGLTLGVLFYLGNTGG